MMYHVHSTSVRQQRQQLAWSTEVDTVRLPLAWSRVTTSSLPDENPVPDLLSTEQYDMVQKRVNDVLRRNHPGRWFVASLVVLLVLGVGLQLAGQLLGTLVALPLLALIPMGYILGSVMCWAKVARPTQKALDQLRDTFADLNEQRLGAGATFELQTLGGDDAFEKQQSCMSRVLGLSMAYVIIRYPKGSGPSRVPEAMVVCSRCHKSTESGRFCGLCGFMMLSTCENCQSDLKPGAAFCADCGVAVPSAPPAYEAATGQEKKAPLPAPVRTSSKSSRKSGKSSSSSSRRNKSSSSRGKSEGGADEPLL